MSYGITAQRGAVASDIQSQYITVYAPRITSTPQINPEVFLVIILLMRASVISRLQFVCRGTNHVSNSVGVFEMQIFGVEQKINQVKL